MTHRDNAPARPAAIAKNASPSAWARIKDRHGSVRAVQAANAAARGESADRLVNRFKLDVCDADFLVSALH